MLFRQQVRKGRRVRRVVDVDDVRRGNRLAKCLGCPPASPLRPLQRAARAGAVAVLVRPRADKLARIAGVTRRDVRCAVARPDVLRNDRDRVHVGVPVEVVRDALEVEAHDVALRRDALEPGLPHRGDLRTCELARLERELHVGGGEGLAVVPGHALAEGDDVALTLPPATSGEPGNELVLERVVAEKRLVQQPERPGRVARPKRVEAVEGPPRGARGVQGLSPRERERRPLLCVCRA